MGQRIKLTENMLRGMVRKAISEELMRIDEAKHNYGKYIRRKIYDYLVENGLITAIDRNALAKNNLSEDELDIMYKADEELDEKEYSIKRNAKEKIEKIFNETIDDNKKVREIESELRRGLLHDYSSYKDPLKRLCPIFVRIALEHGIVKNEFYRDDEVITGLYSIMKYLEDEFKKNKGKGFKTVDSEGNEIICSLSEIPNNITYEELKELCSGAFNEDGTAVYTRLNIDSIDYSNSKGYEIRKNVSFEDANEIGKWSGDGYNGSQLCYTQGKGTWERFTNNGQNTVYVLLSNDWKTYNNEERELPVPPEQPTEKTPYDDYGLSMIFLFVAPNGELAYSNVRWNHGYSNLSTRKTDYNFTKKEIEEITGLSFNEHFINVGRPKKNDLLRLVEHLVLTGEDKDYDGIKKLKLDNEGRYSLISIETEYLVNVFDEQNKKFVYTKWFNYFDNHDILSDGCCYKIVYEGYTNIIKPDGSLMFDGPLREWPDDISLHSNRGFYIFKANNKFNLVDYKGNILYEPNNQNEWFDDINIAKGKCSIFLASKGKQFYVVTSFGEITDFETGINHLISEGYDLKDIFFKYNVVNIGHGLCTVKIGNHQILMRGDGTLVTTQKFNHIYGFCGDLAVVNALNGKYNYIDKNGNFLYKPNEPNKWFDGAHNFNDGFAIVSIKSKYNFIDSNGNILYKPDEQYEWFDRYPVITRGEHRIFLIDGGEQIYTITKDDGIVNLEDGIKYFISKGDTLETLFGYDYVLELGDERYAVEIFEDELLLMHKDGMLLSELRFRSMSSFRNGFSCIRALNGMCNYIDKNGNILYKPNELSEWFECCDQFKHGVAVVMKYGNYNLIDKNCNLLYEPNNPEKWFYSISVLDNYALVLRRDDKKNYLFFNGKLLSPNIWFNEIGKPGADGLIPVELNYELYYIDQEGNFYDINTKQPIPTPTGNNVTNESMLSLKRKIQGFVNEAILRYTFR